jgi:hypothetical protein
LKTDRTSHPIRRAVLDSALQKYRLGKSDPIPVGGIAQLKPALRLMNLYRLRIEEIMARAVRTRLFWRV